MPSPVAAGSLTETRGSATPRTIPRKSLFHPPLTNNRTRVNQRPTAFVTLTWSPVLTGASKPPNTGQLLPSILKAGQLSDSREWAVCRYLTTLQLYYSSQSR
ncbi:hypothetical protein E2C01_057957 [Portunus trituberculatus]|uniref:Uncharacterized protein n=1 Tax=Portunus trituberculatus TaxID=210409 RepID=A0A5B7GUC8_PORTR|nr:hypothetical protein [Portunus trituberculatus]